MTDDRTAEHARNEELERVLDEINRILASSDSVAVGGPTKLQHPLVLLIGVARCGSTLLYQWLAASGAFCYPANIASKFWASPRFAALVQHAILDLDPRHEILPPEAKKTSYNSELGKTRGAASPHEFWYFWRRYFPFDDVGALPGNIVEATDFRGFERDVAAFQNVFGQPMVMKGMIINHHLAEFARRIRNCVFVHVTRDPIENAASLLRARGDFFGDTNAWYSFKPPEYRWLAGESAETQVMGQVLATNRAIGAQLKAIPEKSIQVEYEEFCNAPETVWRKLGTLLRARGFKISAYHGPTHFRTRRRIDDRTQLERQKARLL